MESGFSFCGDSGFVHKLGSPLKFKHSCTQTGNNKTSLTIASVISRTTNVEEL